jgi:hypothetical protein
MLIILRSLMWLVWATLLYSFSLYLPILNDYSQSSSFSSLSGLKFLEPEFRVALMTILIAVAALEVAGTFLLRHFFLNKPYAKGRFAIRTLSGSARFLLVNLLVWSVASSIAAGGLTFALLTKQTQWFYPFFAAFLIVMLFNMPKFRPFEGCMAER